MSKLLRSRFSIAPLFCAGLVLLTACGGSKVAPTAAELTPAAPDKNTPYFVMPTVNPLDGSLRKAVNDPGPEPVSDAECHVPDGMFLVPVTEFVQNMVVTPGAPQIVDGHSYTFNDSTSELVPSSLTWEDWEPGATPIPPEWGGKLCAGPGQEFEKRPDAAAYAIHLTGVFRNYGAGLGTAFFNHQSVMQAADPNLIFTKVTDYMAGTGPVGSSGIGKFWDGDHFLQEVDQAVFAYVDLSAYDGVTFWARRGPYGEPGFRVAALDRTTSDDFNRQLPPDRAACRSKYILCSCQNAAPCTDWDPTTAPLTNGLTLGATPATQGFLVAADGTPKAPKKGSYCWDPSLDTYPPMDPTLRCGQTACDSIDSTLDRPSAASIPSPLFSYISNPVSAERALAWYPPPGKITCSPEPYVFQDSTMPSGRYCYDPGKDLPPPEAHEQCGDSFLAPVTVDLNWHRYVVPFKDMRQGNINHRSPGIDKAVMESLIFAFPGGNLDVWIDGLSLYKMTK